MTDKLKTAVIGVGNMGQNHARIYSEISQLVAVVDTNRARGMEIADRYQAKWYQNSQNFPGVTGKIILCPNKNP